MKRVDTIYIPYNQKTVRFKMKLLKEYLDAGWILQGSKKLKAEMSDDPVEAFILTRRTKKSG